MQSIIVISLYLLFTHKFVKCSNLEARDEKTFANGTLIGSYTYVDTQGNHVHVKYSADSDGYSINLKGCKVPEHDVQNNYKSSYLTTDPTTLILDTMVPLKLELPEVENMYTIENPHNTTNDVDDAKRKTWAESDEKDDQPIDYDTFNPVLHTSKSKTHEKEKGYKKFIRKIRQTLENFEQYIPRPST